MERLTLKRKVKCDEIKFFLFYFKTTERYKGIFFSSVSSLINIEVEHLNKETKNSYEKK